MNMRAQVMEKQKPKRVPLGRRNILTVRGIKDDDSFHYRWVNDVGDRLYEYAQAGYEFVPKAGLEAGDKTVESARGTESVLKKGVGFGVTAYFMRVPMEFWKEDQKAKQVQVDAMEADVRKPKVDGFYGNVEIADKSTA